MIILLHPTQHCPPSFLPNDVMTFKKIVFQGKNHIDTLKKS